MTRIKHEFAKPMTVGTGGLGIFYNATDSIDHIDEDITNAGLVLIYERIFHGNRGININDNDLRFVPLGGRMK